MSVLVGGAAFAHTITALALPVLTRLYSPGDFSVLAAFSGMLSVIAVAACLRFDVAVSIPEHDEDACNVLALALASATCVSASVAIVVLFLPHRGIAWLAKTGLEGNLWLLPVGVMLAACYSALQFWFVRRKEFGLIARSRVSQSAASAAAQIGLGSLGAAPVGLLLGNILNAGAASIVLGYRLVRADRVVLRAVRRPRMRAMFTEYYRFPKYSTGEALCNTAAIQVPIVMIAALASGPEAGYLILAMQVMQAPMAVIGTAIGQVYLSRAPDEYRAGRLAVFTTDVFGGLIKSGVGPLVFVGIVAPSAFAILFGSEWQRAGLLLSWMTPWFVMQFLASPISMALHVTNQQRVALALQVFGLVLRVAAVIGAAAFARGAISEAYALSGFAFYLAYFLIIIRIVGARASHMALGVRGGIAVVLVWAIMGCVVATGINGARAAENPTREGIVQPAKPGKTP